MNVGVFNVPYQQALALQEGAYPLAGRLDERFQRLGARGRQAAKHRRFAACEIHPVQKQNALVSADGSRPAGARPPRTRFWGRARTSAGRGFTSTGGKGQRPKRASDGRAASVRRRRRSAAGRLRCCPDCPATAFSGLPASSVCLRPSYLRYMPALRGLSVPARVQSNHRAGSRPRCRFAATRRTQEAAPDG